MEVPALTTTNLLALRCVLIFLICAVLSLDAVTSDVAALSACCCLCAALSADC